MRMNENLAFTDRCIAKLQRLSIEQLFCQVGTDYLMRLGRMAYDFERRLYWVKLPNGTWQVAVWMMPACEPR